jgi:hypothetical protein
VPELFLVAGATVHVEKLSEDFMTLVTVCRAANFYGDAATDFLLPLAAFC